MSDDLSTSRNLHRMLVSLALFVVGTALVLSTFGASWAGLMLTLILVLMVAVVRHMGWLNSTSSDDGDDRVERGTAACPHCESMQTDYEIRYDPRGREYEQLHCFACDRDIDESELDR